MAFWFQLLIGLALAVVSYLLAPKPKKHKPEAAQEMDEPTAEAGKPIPVVFGTISVKSPNVLHFSDKSQNTYKVKA
jgi:uncharacterized protein YbaP (TraB family)